MTILERMLAIIPHHKGTDKLIGSLRAKMSKLKEESERRPQAQKRAGQLYNVKRDGAGQVLCIGFPNSGKSSLVSALSGEPLEVGDYPYTTRILQPRMMRYEDIWIQLVDTPAIGDESTNLWLGNMLRKTDLIVPILSLSDALETEFELVMDEIGAHLPETEGNPASMLIVVNKLDLTEFVKYLEEFEGKVGKNRRLIPVSAKDDVNLHQLREMLFSSLAVIRLYSKLPGKKPDLETPFILRKEGNVLDFAGKVHKDFTEKLKYAKLWRKDTYNGMMVSKDFILEDKDILELHL
jgi:uncharacterized protein